MDYGYNECSFLWSDMVSHLSRFGENPSNTVVGFLVKKKKKNDWSSHSKNEFSTQLECPKTKQSS